MTERPSGTSSASTSAPCPAGPSWSGSPTAPSSARRSHDYPHGGHRRHAAGDRPMRCRRTGPCRSRPTTATCCGIAVPAAIAAAGVDPGQVIGIGIDFTACTVLPTPADGTPLCELPRWRDRPHAYVKLWKHHAAQAQADRINAARPRAARAVDRPLRRDDLGGVGVRQGAAAARGDPEVYAARRALDRGGRLDRLAALRPSRPATSCTAGYKGIYQDGRYPDRGLPGGAATRTSPASSTSSTHPIVTRSAPGRRPDRSGRRRGPACRRASRSRSATSTRTSPPPPPPRWRRAGWSPSWAPRPAT